MILDMITSQLRVWAIGLAWMLLVFITTLVVHAGYAWQARRTQRLIDKALKELDKCT